MPADGYVFNIDVPHPLRDIDGLRVFLKKALADLSSTSLDMGDLYGIMDTALDMVSGALAKSSELQAAIDTAEATHAAMRQATADALAAARQAAAAAAQAQSDLSALTGRVAALEVKPAVRNVATAAPVSLGLLAIGTRDITLTWDRTLPDAAYDVEFWPTAGLLGTATFTVKTKSTTNVVVTVKNTALIAAGGSVGAIAVRTT